MDLKTHYYMAYLLINLIYTTAGDKPANISAWSLLQKLIKYITKGLD